MLSAGSVEGVRSSYKLSTTQQIFRRAHPRSARITPASFQTITTFIHNNPQKMIRFASKILAYFVSIACPFPDAIISNLPFRGMFGCIQVAESPAGWDSSMLRIISHCCSFPLPDQSLTLLRGPSRLFCRQSLISADFHL
jgi:hypothetical protein